MTRILNKRTWKRPAIFKAFFMLLCAVILTGTSLLAQTHELKLNQRRMGNQIGVEVWAKSLTANTPNLGNVTISVVYNDTYLKPAPLEAANPTWFETGNPAATTDSIYYDMNVAQPFQIITSPFSVNEYGFEDLQAQAVDVEGASGIARVFTLHTILQNGGIGYQPGMSGKGTFIGLIKFDIIQSASAPLGDEELTMIDFNTIYDFAPVTVVTDVDGNDLTASTTLAATSDFLVRDITILSPNDTLTFVNRFNDPPLASITPNNGFPVYFERSGLLNELGTYGVYGTSTLAYQVSLSLYGGRVGTWTEVGRVAETSENADLFATGELENYVSGDVGRKSETSAYYITQGDGVTLPDITSRNPERGYGGVMRFIWEANNTFPYRSEEARLKISQLEADDATTTFSSASIANRDVFVTEDRYDITDFGFTLARNFFTQLNGDDYFRTIENVSTPTKITVECWVNLNYGGELTAEPAFVASGSPTSDNMGPWMLYLKDGLYPAFRALSREKDSFDEHLSDIVSAKALETIGSTSPIEYEHGNNWVHLAATVDGATTVLYMNGEIVASETNTAKSVMNLYPMQHPVYIGVNPNDGGLDKPENYINAGIKEVKFWRVALSQAKIRQYIAGVSDPEDVDIDVITDKNFLELYYPLQISGNDFATELKDQWGSEDLDFYQSGSAMPVNNLVFYRPDRAHIILTSPVGGEGISNRKGEDYRVRWVGYGIGDVSPNTPDVQISVSRDGGLTWFDAIGPDASPALPLDEEDVEDGATLWSPYNNITVRDYENDLQAVVSIDENYSKECLMKISGTEANGENSIYDVSELFTVAPNFSFSNVANTQVMVAANRDLSLSGGTNMIEAWIKPYRFPTEEEISFPIFCKKEEGNVNYTFDLMYTGQLAFSVFDTTAIGGDLKSVYSDINFPVITPNTEAKDSTWTHVVVWCNLSDGGETSEVRFFIDGFEVTDLESNLGGGIKVDRNNKYPAYIGYEPARTNYEDGISFIGEYKEVRFWSGNPAGVISDAELLRFIQGAQGVRASEFVAFAGVNYSENLVACWSFNGGSWNNNGVDNSIAVVSEDASSDLVAVVSGEGFAYKATQPFIKIVEPRYEQDVSNEDHDLRVRWVGWDYDRNDDDAPFRNGSDIVNMADLDFSVGGGGGDDAKPYQPVASQAYSEVYNNSIEFRYSDSDYEFTGTASKTQYAMDMDMAYCDPDENNDGVYADQAPIDASQLNGRFRLIGRASINGSELTYNNETEDGVQDGIVYHLLAESRLFNITPPSNFTLRVLLEGYHTGSNTSTGGIQNDLGKSFDSKGLSVKFYENLSNDFGEIVASTESLSGYLNSDALDIHNLNGGTNTYANVPLVLIDLTDGERYFVSVDHINHLPITSRYAAPFIFQGDDADTWVVESGWDFTSWNGVAGNEMFATDATQTPPAFGNKYSAYGPSETNPSEGEYAATQLRYNSGRAGNSTDAMPSMVGGDVRRDGTIDAKDRVDVNAGVAGLAVASDVTGDGFTNADDRIIVYRNSGMTTEPMGHPKDAVVTLDNLGPIAAPLEMADYTIADNAVVAKMIREEQAYYENGGTNADRLAKKYNIENRLQGINGIAYEVSAVATLSGNYVDVEIFVKNTGDVWAMGNSTFGLDYDPTALTFEQYLGEGSILFGSSNTGYGYSSAYSNPASNTSKPISGLRTIDVVHAQNGADIPGVEVPSEFTSVGTLRFAINRTVDYVFDWHPLTTVHDVDGLSLTDNGDFKYIEPIVIASEVEITYPTTGEVLEANRGYNVEWSESDFDDLMVDLLLSVDGGDSWTKINDEVLPVTAREFYWTAPNENSSECKIQLRNAENESMLDVTGLFSILASPVTIYEPCAICGTLLSGTISDIVWATNQNINVYFEFSANGTSDWTVASEVVSSTLTSITWDVPVADTKDAVIRMLNMEGEILAVSTPFKVISGSLDITSPEGSVVKGGKVTEINWTANNVNMFDLYLSIDGGNNWEMIFDDATASANTTTWSVPNVDANDAKLKAVHHLIPELEYDIASFMIASDTKVNDPAANGYYLGTPVPNPFSEISELSLTLPEFGTVTAELYDISGNRVATMINGQAYGAGTHNLTIDATNIATGTYIVYVTVGEYTLTQRVLVIK